jgi:hypothetical protein
MVPHGTTSRTPFLMQMDDFPFDKTLTTECSNVVPVAEMLSVYGSLKQYKAMKCSNIIDDLSPVTKIKLLGLAYSLMTCQ